MILTIKQRLTLTAGISLFTVFVLAGFMLFNLNHLAKMQNESSFIANQAITTTDASGIGARMYQIIADAVINQELEATEKDWYEIKKELETNLIYVEKNADTPEEVKSADDARKASVEMVRLFEQEMLPFLKVNEAGIAPRIRELDGKLDEQAAAVAENLTNVAKSMQADSKKSDATFDVTKTRTIQISIIISLLGIIFVWVASFFTLRHIVTALGGELTDTINEVKKLSMGNLNSSIALQPRDNSSLLYAVKTMQETLNGFVSEQQLISSKHAGGFISHKMDIVKFKGTYAQMASDINNLVQSHIDVNMHVVDVVSQYARGDFSRDIDRLPAEKAKITTAIDAVKTALISISKEIEMLVAAGAQGDFSKRSDANHFEFMFKDMLANLNALMATSDVAFSDVLRVSNALAQGDLTQQITKDYPVGTFRNTKMALNGTVENLKALVGEIKASSDTINTASQEIAAGNNDLSHRTEQQAASLEETAASMQELTSTVQANSENAKHANEMALSSSDIARKGVAVVNKVVTTMNDINDSSRKVVDIITVIDGIAFQTNILALNAAVEAARAGEQGRGFAVVASEVRSLAQRAASAAGEIKSLIGNSVDKVEDGSKLVSEAGRTMEEIVHSIQNVTKIIAQITAASTEQTTGIQQVNQAIGQMDDVTQQNAALVEQAAAAAEALEEQARQLASTMGNFKMDSSQPSQSQPSAATVMKTYVPKTTTPVAKKIEKQPEKQPEKPIVAMQTTAAVNIDLDGALKKHADWKVKLRTAIVNKEKLDATTISKDNCCDFGKWLHHSDTSSKVGHLSSYKDCVGRHAEFHVAAGKVATLINDKKYEDAQQMLTSSDSEFIQTSGAVGTAIMRLKKETAPKPVEVVKKAVPKAAPAPVATLSDDWEEF